MGAYSHWYKLNRWRILRQRMLKHNPLCCTCKSRGKIALASVVDHIVPHGGNLDLFWDTNNLQCLCYHCHNSVKQSYERIGYEKEVGLDGWPVHALHPGNKK
jgi:5-methylcytosine-specific restriction enzyme A